MHERMPGGVSGHLQRLLPLVIAILAVALSACATQQQGGSGDGPKLGSGPAPDSVALYWVTVPAGPLMKLKAPPGRVGPTQPQRLLPGPYQPVVAFDDACGHIYAVDPSGQIVKVDPAGNQSSVVVARAGEVTAMHFDDAAGRLYWQDSFGFIRHIDPQAPGDAEVIYQRRDAQDFKVDEAAGRLFIARRGSPSGTDVVEVIDLESSRGETIITGSSIMSVALDPARKQLYLLGEFRNFRRTSVLFRVNYDGTELTRLWDEPVRSGAAAGLAVDSSRRMIYWGHTGAIRRADFALERVDALSPLLDREFRRIALETGGAPQPNRACPG